MDPETIANQSAAADHAHAASGSSVNQIRITDKSKALVIISILVAFNACMTALMYAKWREAERETRMQEYYLLELDAKFIGAGLKKPEESIARKIQKDGK
jgi:hypothetical protein